MSENFVVYEKKCRCLAVLNSNLWAEALTIVFLHVYEDISSWMHQNKSFIKHCFTQLLMFVVLSSCHSGIYQPLCCNYKYIGVCSILSFSGSIVQFQWSDFTWIKLREQMKSYTRILVNIISALSLSAIILIQINLHSRHLPKMYTGIFLC